MKKTDKKNIQNNLNDNDFDYFSGNSKLNINCKNFPIEFFSIIAIFSEDCDNQISKIYSSMERLFIEGSVDDKSNSLLLRYHDSNLIIAKIQFINTRKGNMTKLYELLKFMKKKYKLNQIIIENCHSSSIISWCIKNNFVPFDKYNTYVEANKLYILRINHITQNLLLH